MVHSLTWDVGLVAVFALLLAYSLLIRKHKALATLVSVYISYFVATSWGDWIAGFFNGNRVSVSNVWIKANITSFTVEVVLLIIFTFLLSTFIKLGGRRARYAMIEVAAYSICTVALGFMFILLLMPDAQRAGVLQTSHIAPYVYEWRQWILIVPIFVMIFFGIYGNEDA